MDEEVFDELRQLLYALRANAVLSSRQEEAVIAEVNEQIARLDELREKSRIRITPKAEGG